MSDSIQSQNVEIIATINIAENKNEPIFTAQQLNALAV